LAFAHDPRRDLRAAVPAGFFFRIFGLAGIVLILLPAIVIDINMAVI
jgi:hypothetical protein